MNYLKNFKEIRYFESVKSKEEIKKLCSYYLGGPGPDDFPALDENEIDYTINSDGSVDVNGDVYLNNFDMRVFRSSYSKELPIKFNRVSGNFYCSYNQLTTLKGAPEYVDGDFICVHNNLITLEYAPKYVGGDFICKHNDLNTLKYGPQTVKGNYVCNYNRIVDFNYTTKIGGDFISDGNARDYEDKPTWFMEKYVYPIAK